MTTDRAEPQQPSIRRLNYTLWMSNQGGCEPPKEWQEAYTAGYERRSHEVRQRDEVIDGASPAPDPAQEAAPVALDDYADKIMADTSEHERSIIADLTVIMSESGYWNDPSMQPGKKDFWTKMIACAARSLILNYRKLWLEAIASPPAAPVANGTNWREVASSLNAALLSNDASHAEQARRIYARALIAATDTPASAVAEPELRERCVILASQWRTVANRSNAMREAVYAACISDLREAIAATPDQAIASSKCPMDGIDTPHAHDQDKVIDWLRIQAQRFAPEDWKNIAITRIDPMVYGYAVSSTWPHHRTVICGSYEEAVNYRMNKIPLGYATQIHKLYTEEPSPAPPPIARSAAHEPEDRNERS